MSETLKLDLSKKVLRIFRLAVKEELQEHKRLGNPIYISRKGKIVKIPARNIAV
jgi:hypothetical protein